MNARRDRILLERAYQMLCPWDDDEESPANKLPGISISSLPTLSQAAASASGSRSLPPAMWHLLAAIPLTAHWRMVDRQNDLCTLRTLERACRFLRMRADRLRRERILLMCLDEHYQLARCLPVIDGSFADVAFDPRDVLHAALTCNAYAAILCHNHPNGNSRFSSADVSATRRLLFAFRHADVAVLDHLLVTHRRILSMRAKLCLSESLWMSSGSAAIPTRVWLRAEEKSGPQRLAPLGG